MNSSSSSSSSSTTARNRNKVLITSSQTSSIAKKPPKQAIKQTNVDNISSDTYRHTFTHRAYMQKFKQISQQH